MILPNMPITAKTLRELRQEHGVSAPILILAPTTRCGSTLLQRAINQAEEAIIYGENFVFMESLPVLGGAFSTIEPKSLATQTVLDTFLKGNKGMDASALFPDYREYRKMLLTFVYQTCNFYRDESQRHGYRRWGIKHQIANLQGFHNFVYLVPEFKSITIFRDLLDVAKSMLTRWPENLATLPQCFAIGRRWRDHLAYLLRLDQGRNMVIRYEEMVAAPEAVISKVESHLGVALSRAAFEKKVNAHTFDFATGKAGEEYKPPSSLPENKLRALLDGAQPLYGKLGYKIPS